MREENKKTRLFYHIRVPRRAITNKAIRNYETRYLVNTYTVYDKKHTELLLPEDTTLVEKQKKQKKRSKKTNKTTKKKKKK